MNHLKRFYMKKITIYRFLAFLVTLTVVLGSCTKEMSEVRLEPTLSTSQTFGVKSDSATVVGFVVAQGDGFTERGVCYNVAPAPTVNNSKVAYTKDTPTATFNVVLSGLKYATKYYARAYATTDGLTVYGEEVTFTTLPVKPTVTTVAITEITGKSASTGGNVTVTGGATVTAGCLFWTQSESHSCRYKNNQWRRAGRVCKFTNRIKRKYQILSSFLRNKQRRHWLWS
jgi:hypothetical protein